MKTWCIAYKTSEGEGWCSVKGNAQPDESASSVETACEHFVILPWGVDLREPTCEECKRVLAGSGAEGWIAQYRYGDQQTWHNLGEAKPVSQRAKQLCREFLSGEPNNAGRLQFRIVDPEGKPWEMSAPPHGSRMRWDLIPFNSPYFKH